MKKRKGPWIVTNSRIVYQNPWIRVREDKVIRPDKKPGVFGVVEQIGGVSVIPMDKKGSVYLTKEYHYAVERITIEAVSGSIDGKETKLQAAKRELKEETGFTAKKWTYLGVVDPLTTILVSPNYMYLAEDLMEGEDEQEGTEQIRVIKVPFLRALNMVMRDEITHGASKVALLKISELRRANKL
jgi:ADP-ribose pyrophosphatase